jgi:putative spermidine/putrescine transport system permease protein
MRGRPVLVRGLPAAALLAPGLLILASLFAACLILLRYSFNDWDPVRTMVPAWTLQNYADLLLDPAQQRALVTTLRISLTVTLACLLLGYPVAVAITRAGRYRGLLMFLLVTPMLTDVLIRAYGWIVMLGQAGLVNTVMTGIGLWSAPRRLIYTELSVVLELIHEMVPFMVLPVAAVLERIDPALRHAAMNLRASPLQTFLHITLPLSVPGIMAGTLLVFALSMSAFVAPLVLGGGNVPMITVLMSQTMFATLNWPRGAAQSVLLVGIVLVLLLLYRRALAAGRAAA